MTNSFKAKRRKSEQKNRKYKEGPNGNFSTKNTRTEIENSLDGLNSIMEMTR